MPTLGSFSPTLTHTQRQFAVSSSRVLLVTSGTPQATTANTTGYFGLGNAAIDIPSSTESVRYTLHRTPGRLANLYARITANTIAGNSTIKVRNNAANTSMTVTIGASATGVFEDTTNEAIIAAGDLLSYQFVPGAATNTMTIGLLSTTFDADSNTVIRMVCGGAGSAFTTASVSRYNEIAGAMASNNATESLNKTRIRNTCIGKNLAANVSANARTTTTTIRSRKNGANGTMSIAVSAAATGWFEDTTNSDSLIPGSDYNTTVDTLTGTETMTIRSICLDLESTNSQCNLVTANTNGLTQLISVTNYFPVGGNLVAGTTEADRKVKTRDIFTLSELTIVLSTNTVTASSTLTLRKNGVDTALTLTIPTSTTGVISDSTNIASVVATDDLNLSLVTGGAGTSLTIRDISLNTSGFARRGKSLATETITISEPAFTRLAAKIKALATQTIAIAEDVVRVVTPIGGANIVKTLDDTIVIGEAIARVKGLSRLLATQTVSISEGLNRLLAESRTLPESLTIGEALARIAAKIRSLAAQTVTISEAIDRSYGPVRNPSDTITISEAIARVLGKVRALSQTVTISEAIATIAGKVRSLAAQTITIAEDVVRVVGTGGAQIEKTLSQTITIAEASMTRLKAVWRLQPP
jgi:hypothetical protein